MYSFIVAVTNKLNKKLLRQSNNPKFTLKNRQLNSKFATSQDIALEVHLFFSVKSSNQQNNPKKRSRRYQYFEPTFHRESRRLQKTRSRVPLLPLRLLHLLLHLLYQDLGKGPSPLPLLQQGADRGANRGARRLGGLGRPRERPRWVPAYGDGLGGLSGLPCARGVLICDSSDLRTLGGFRLSRLGGRWGRGGGRETRRLFD